MASTPEETSPSGATPTPEVGEGPTAHGFRKLAIRGSVWVLLGYGGAQVIRFASSLVLTRLLFPEAFGLMLLVNVFIHGLQMFSDIGIGMSIIQDKRSDADFLNTAWTIQVLRGLLLWIFACLAAYPYSLYYENEDLFAMLPVAGLGALIDGFTATSLHTANRRLLVGRLQVLEILTQCMSAAVTIVAALITGSVWALVFGGVASSLFRAVSSHFLLPGIRNRFVWDREAAAALLHFGMWITISSILTFLAQQGDRLIFGKIIPKDTLGNYDLAQKLWDVPAMLISAVAFRIFFPLFSEVRRSSEDINSVYRRSSSAVFLVSGAAAISLAILGPFLVAVLYDARWATAGRILQIVALGIWFNGLVNLAAAANLACGQVKWQAAANGGRFLWLLCTVPAAYKIWGLDAAVLCVALGDMPRYSLLALGVNRSGLFIFRRDLISTAAFLASLAAGFLSLRAFPQPPGIMGLAAATIAGLSVWFLFNLRTLRDYRAQIRTMILSA